MADHLLRIRPRQRTRPHRTLSARQRHGSGVHGFLRSHQFDQAGIFVRVSNERWVKAGVEFADGRPQIGAVVTDGLSDWSLAPAPDWAAQRILIRVSRSGNALTIRAKPSDHDDLQLIRVVPFEPELVALAGPYTCAHAGRSHRQIPQLAVRATRPEPPLDRRVQR